MLLPLILPPPNCQFDCAGGDAGAAAAEAAPIDNAPTFPIPTPDAVKQAEQQAVAVHKKLNAQSASVRQYLVSTAQEV